MILRSGRILDALDYVEMPENTVATAMATNMIIPDRKQVLVDSPLRNKRMIGLGHTLKTWKKKEGEHS